MSSPGNSRPIHLILCAVVLLLAIAAIYNCILFSDRTNLCGGYDVYRETGPYSYYMDYALHHGEIPFWNPLTLCGMPFAANPVTAFFYPGNLLRSLLSFHPTPFKTQVGWITLMVLHLLLAGIGIIVLAREHKLGYAASFVAVFIFMFGGNWIRRICEYHFICMVAWLPLLLILARRAVLRETLREKMRYALMGGIVFGIALLSGSINIAPYLGITVGAYALLCGLLNLPTLRSLRSPAIQRQFAGNILFLGVLFVIGALVAAALLLPGAEFASFTGRVKGGAQALAHPHYAGTWKDLYHTLIRLPGLKWEVENIRGAGIGALLLVIAGFSSRRYRDVALWGGLSLILFDCSMGRPFPIASLVERLSPIQLIASTRAWDFAVLPLGLLAGIGVDAIAAESKPLWWRAARDAILLLVGITALYSLSFLLGPKSFLSMGRIAVLVPAATLIVMIMASWTPRGRFWPVAMVVLVFAEMFVWNHRYVPFIIMKPNFSKTAHRYPGATSFWSDNRRGTDPIQNRLLYDLKPAMHGYEPLHMTDVRKVLASDSRGSVYTRSVKDYEVTRQNQRGNLFLKRSFWLARQYVRGPLPDKESLFPPTTTVYLPRADISSVPRVEPTAVPRHAVSETADVIRFVNEDELRKINGQIRSGMKKRNVTLPSVTMPGVHSALCLRYKSATAATLEVIFRDPNTGDWQLGKTTRIMPTAKESAILELPTPDFHTLSTTLTISAVSSTPRASLEFQDIYLMADRADEDALITIVSRSPNTVDVNVGELPGPRVLTFLDAAYPGWHAYLDGNETPIWVANDVFKAVEVPAGNHKVRFVFRPISAYVGIAISIATILGALLGILLLRQRRNRKSNVPTGCYNPSDQQQNGPVQEKAEEEAFTRE